MLMLYVLVILEWNVILKLGLSIVGFVVYYLVELS